MLRIPAFEHLYSKPWFAYLGEHPDLAAVLADLMTGETAGEAGAIAAAHDFSRSRRIVDVGGGHGALLPTLLDRHPGASGVLFDLPQVVAGARAPLEALHAQGRATTTAGDFFEAVAPGGDAYLLKYVVHD